MAPKVTRRAVVALVALALLGGAAGHVCPPCKHDVQVKQNVGRMALWCAKEYDHSLVAFNRTLQLLETLASKAASIPGCEVDESALQSAVNAAAASHAVSVGASADIQADVTGFVSSDLFATYPEFTVAFKDKLSALGESALESERSLGAGLSEALQGCFQETPLPLPQVTLDTEAAEETLEAVAEEEESGGDNIALAWGLSLMAGFSTILGAGLVGIIKPNQHRLMSFLNAFTAGIMVQGSVAGLGNEAAVLLADNDFNQTSAFWTIFMMFFLGCLLCVGLEVLVHKLAEVKATQGQMLPVLPDELTARASEESKFAASSSHGSDDLSIGIPAAGVDQQGGDCGCAETAAPPEDLSRSSVIVMVGGISLHNIAEGMATFIAALANKSLGIALAIGMVLHNVPEGFAISVPWYTATGSRLQGFLLASVAGVAEILSAGAIYLVIVTVGDVQVKQTVFACLFALAGGMMTFIALVELYPAALKKTPDSTVVPASGMFAGFAVMWLALGQLGVPK